MLPTPEKMTKMRVLAFEDAKAAETGSFATAKAETSVLINPESYAHDYKLKFADSAQGQGTSGQQLKFEMIMPQEMTFEFLFDNTGIIDGRPRLDISQDLADFKDLMIGFHGETHQPYYVKLAWGTNAVFIGRANEFSINYKLFSPNGNPLRAIVKVKLLSSVEEQKRANEENRKSPDLTHIRVVKAGDTLPLLCTRIYGEPRYYLQVAAVNGLGNFRELEPGKELVFPPLDKNTN
jgi:hypothetical protein